MSHVSQLVEVERDPADPTLWNGKGPPPRPIQRGTLYGRLRVLSASDIDTAEPRDYLLKGIMSKNEMSLWVGPPKCGKSFLLLHVAYQLSLGRPVFGRRVRQTTVLYVAAEGEGGIANRIKALRDRYGPSDRFHFIAQPADLLHSSAGHLADLKAAAGNIQPGLVVVDTLSRALAGGDENSPVDMGQFVKNIGDLKHETSAHFAIVHHGTKLSNGATPRGHSSLTGADDALIEVAKNPDGSRTASLIHSKDDADGLQMGFHLESIDLGLDEDGDPITTLLVREDAEPTPQPQKKQKPTNNEQVALNVFDRAIDKEPSFAVVDDSGEKRRVLRQDVWRRAYYEEAEPGKSRDTKEQAFRRAFNGLLGKNLLRCKDDLFWRPEVW